MRITIRMDDITPDMDWEKFLRFKKLLDAHNIKPLIGVVSDNQDKKLQINKPREDFWAYVKGLQEEGWIIALHGYNHLYTTKKSGLFPIGNKSEFAGLPLAKQDAMIREGKRILRTNNIETDIFMAPSHSFDKNTLKALKKNGFTGITDGFGREPYERDGLVFYPISVSKGKSIKDEKDGLVTFVYHVNTMTDGDFKSFEKLFDKAEVVSYSTYRDYSPKAGNSFGWLCEYLMAKGKFLLVRLRKFI